MAMSVSAFNETMEQFLTELNLTFPENKAVIKFQAAFELMKQTAPSKILDNFMISVKPYSQKITSKDESFILEDSVNIESLSGIDLASMWSQASDTTKSAIWQYLHTLVFIGTTVKIFPKETMSMIEQVAEKCAGQIDPMSIMELMNTISRHK
jgi:CRISPR-associated protein Cas8b1/Cst1 subtype I-B